MGNSFNDLALIIFTTLAPAGVVAYLCIAAFLITRKEFTEQHDRLNHMLMIVLFLAWVGFIASATHLGTPANALHVVWGVGRSPLSNEVAAAVVFLFLSGMYWMYTFKETYSVLFAKVLLGASMVSACVMLYFTSYAYNVPTVVSWDTGFAPAHLIVNGLFSGTALATFVLFTARCNAQMWPWILVLVSMIMLITSTIFGFAHVENLQNTTNNICTALSVFPQYPLYILAHICVGSAGVAALVFGMRLNTSFKRGAFFAGIGVIVIIAAAFIMRYPFYATYLSVGF